MKSRVAVTMALVAIILGAQHAAKAHDPTGFYPQIWEANQLPNLTYKFRANVPSGAFRDRVEQGGNQWTNVSGVNLNFVRGVGEPGFFNWKSCTAGPQNFSTIHFVGAPGTYGETVLCEDDDGVLETFRINFDANDPWHTGTGDPGPGHVDVWSIAAHEFGHATGWDGHFNNPEMCPFDFNRLSEWQTMCNSLDVLMGDIHGERGKHFRRSLEVHDKHTFEAAYD